MQAVNLEVSIAWSASLQQPPRRTRAWARGTSPFPRTPPKKVEAGNSGSPAACYPCCRMIARLSLVTIWFDRKRPLGPPLRGPRGAHDAVGPGGS
jgi:hypothetical protein